MSMAAAYGMKKAKRHGGADCSMCGGGACKMSKGGAVGKGDDVVDKVMAKRYAKGGNVTLKRQLAASDPNTDETTLYTSYPGQSNVGPTTWKPAAGRGYDWIRNQDGSYSMDDYSDPATWASNRKKYSEGGQVANATPPEADEKPAEFDDLVLDDDLEASNPGSDQIGDAQEDEDRRDIVAQVMKKRGKQSNPRPA